MNLKVSIRFFNNKEVRAAWDDATSKWWFCIVDVVAAVGASVDARNYWYVMKSRLKKANDELLTKCKGFKLLAPDGKRHMTDCLDSEGIVSLAKKFGKSSVAFLDWFLYSDNTIDGKSRQKAMNVAHPFMEGNGRATRIWLDLMLKRALKRCVDWSKVDKSSYLEAMRQSVSDAALLKELLRPALTMKFDDRETFMKGIDYSYYYEQE